MNSDGITSSRRGVLSEDASQDLTCKRQFVGAPALDEKQLVPDLQVGYNMYCTTCRTTIYSCVLVKAKRCHLHHPVKLRNAIDGLYSLCPRCDVIISREMLFCYRCRRANTEYSSSARQEHLAEIHEWCEAQKPAPPGQNASFYPKQNVHNGRGITTAPVNIVTSGKSLVTNFQGGLDLYCTHCGKNIPFMLLDKPTSLPCDHKHPLQSGLDGVDWMGLYRRCAQCCCVVSDEMEFCYRCGFRNNYFKKLCRGAYSLKLLEEPRRRNGPESAAPDVFSQDILSDSDLFALTDGVIDVLHSPPQNVPARLEAGGISGPISHEDPRDDAASDVPAPRSSLEETSDIVDADDASTTGRICDNLSEFSIDSQFTDIPEDDDVVTANALPDNPAEDASASEVIEPPVPKKARVTRKRASSQKPV